MSYQQAFAGQKYNPEFINSLPHIDTLAEINANEKAVLLELGSILMQYSLDKYLSIVLLHKHFDLSSNEFIADHPTERVLRTSVKKANDLPHYKPIAWTFSRDYSTNSNLYQLCVLKYAPAAYVENAFERHALNNEAMEKIHDCLVKNQMVNLFGIQLRLELPKCEGDEYLLESTDEDCRKQYVKPFVGLVKSTNIMETQWSFTQDNGVLSTYCAVSCVIAPSGFHEKPHKWYS